MTTLHITVGDREQVREETLRFIREVDAEPRAGSESDTERSDTEADESRMVLQFGTYADLVDSLTPLRLELLEAIASEQPASMREAARVVDRDVSDVHSDLKRLEVLGIVELEDGGPRGAIRPVVPFEAIEMRIAYPLFEDDDAGVDCDAASAD